MKACILGNFPELAILLATMMQLSQEASVVLLNEPGLRVNWEAAIRTTNCIMYIEFLQSVVKLAVQPAT